MRSTKPIYVFRVEGHRFDIIATTSPERAEQTLNTEPHVEVRVWECPSIPPSMLERMKN